MFSGLLFNSFLIKFINFNTTIFKFYKSLQKPFLTSALSNRKVKIFIELLFNQCKLSKSFIRYFRKPLQRFLDFVCYCQLNVYLLRDHLLMVTRIHLLQPKLNGGVIHLALAHNKSRGGQKHVS